MSKAFTHIPDLSALVPDVPVDSIVSRTVCDEAGGKLILFAFAAGQSLSEHTAARPAVLHFMRGEARLVLGDEPQTAGPGTWVHMPANLPHSVHADTDTVMLLMLLNEES